MGDPLHFVVGAEVTPTCRDRSKRYSEGGPKQSEPPGVDLGKHHCVPSRVN
jgi:hypothetical protein